MRIFIGLTDAASYLCGLKQGFDALGVEAVFVSFRKDPSLRAVTNQKSNWLLDLTHRVIMTQPAQPDENSLRRVSRYAIRLVLRGALLVWAICACDVFIFGFKNTFLSLYDLPLLKLFHKKIIFVFLGSDARPPYISGAGVPPAGPINARECIRATRRQKRDLQYIERYADICVNHPPVAQFHARTFINFSLLGLPVQPPPFSTNEPSADPSSVRIVHAPTRPEAKGTPIIRAVIEQLRAKGYRIEFVELIGQPNAVVLNELARCDFVVDELYSDVSLGGLGTEAAHFGKPAIVGGYAQAELLQIARVNGMPTALYIRPEQLAETIEKLIVDPDYRLRLGAEAKHFVETHWLPEKVARRFMQMIEGDIPREWLCDPNAIRYRQGWGLPEARVKQSIRAMIEHGGRAALQLSDKPELEDAFVKFAGDNT